MKTAFPTRNIRYCFAVLVILMNQDSDGFVIGNHKIGHFLYGRTGLGLDLATATAETNSITIKPSDFIKKQIEEQGTNSLLPTIDDMDDNSTVISSPATLSKRRETRPFPLSMIIDQEEIKHALLLSAVNPHSIGVLISGRRGTGKSVIARAMQNIVPSHITRIRNSEYNIHPEGTDGIDSFLLHRLDDEEKSLDSLESELIPTPFVQIVSCLIYSICTYYSLLVPHASLFPYILQPLGVMEDCLIGTVDLEQSLERGETVFSPGLLAKAHRGILYVDEINLLEEEVADVLLKVLSDGRK